MDWMQRSHVRLLGSLLIVGVLPCAAQTAGGASQMPPGTSAAPAAPVPAVPPVPPVPVVPLPPSTPRAAIAPMPPIPPLPPVWPLASIGEPTLGFLSSGIGRGEIVKDAPYSATAIVETRQTLADGNRITRRVATQLARDSQGRTRQQQENGTVFITDPVAGKRYVFNPQRKTGRELPAAPAAELSSSPSLQADEMRARADELRRWAQEVATRVRSDVLPNAQVSVERRVGSDAQQPGERVEVIRLGDAHPAMGLPPVVMPMVGPSGAATTRPLASRDIDGVRVDGTRTTWTIEAGRIGNDKPIEIVSERWYSPELMLVVESRHADPRSGERIYRLQNLKRGEPDAALFGVPSDVELRARPEAPRSAPRERK